jgi:hypothetical protein
MICKRTWSGIEEVKDIHFVKLNVDMWYESVWRSDRSWMTSSDLQVTWSMTLWPTGWKHLPKRKATGSQLYGLYSCYVGQYTGKPSHLPVGAAVAPCIHAVRLNTVRNFEMPSGSFFNTTSLYRRMFARDWLDVADRRTLVKELIVWHHTLGDYIFQQTFCSIHQMNIKLMLIKWTGAWFGASCTKYFYEYNQRYIFEAWPYGPEAPRGQIFEALGHVFLNVINAQSI